MKLNILLLCDLPKAGKNANTIIDHIEAIKNYSEHDVFVCTKLPRYLSRKFELNQFDVIVIHYSLKIAYDVHILEKFKKRLQEYHGLKVIFIQDEYRNINKVISNLAALKMDVLFTCFPEQEINKIYPNDKLPNLAKYTNLTGYIPERLTHLITTTPTSERPIHVGYRSRKLPYWLGELGYEKWNIVEKWLHYASRDDVKVDISYHEQDRIYGENWIRYVLSCKATLGVESGASVMDFTGELEKAVVLHQELHPEDSFHTVQEKYLSKHEGKYRLNQISPRCFEAIALKTVLVLYEGEYSGILTPGRHYIELKKDFSNIEEVLACLRDDNFLQNMADMAYQEIALNPKYSYQSFIKTMDSIINHEFKLRSKTKVLTECNQAEFIREMNKLHPIVAIGNLVRYVVNKLNKNQFIQQIQHKVTVFNPLLRKIRTKLGQV